MDPYAGLSKVNTPLKTPLTLSLEEWCTGPTAAKGQRYQLFAVVMHSGVTISHGHYTAYVRMSELKDVKLRDKNQTEEQEEEVKETKDGAQLKEEAVDYDDGEVSFSINTRGHRRASLAGTKSGSKKLSEGGVGLLGGQRSLSSYDLGSSSKQTEKAAGAGDADGPKRRTISSIGQNGDAAPKKEPEAADEASASCDGAEARERQALNSLLEYEGRWMLFDDSEVRLFEEEDFLRACSPETCSSSTPYLLFYRRAPAPGH